MRALFFAQLMFNHTESFSVRATPLAVAAVLFGLTSPIYAAANIVLPDGPNRNLVYGECQTCHDLNYLKESAGISARAWNDILDSMRAYGLRVNDETRGRLLDYLSTYLGPKPPEPGATPPSAAPAASPVDGAALFADNCSGCHQEAAEGVAGKFPPLAGNKDLFLAHNFAPTVVLNGLAGKLEVNGGSFGDQQMPSLDYLTDDEVASVLNYVMSQFGNDANRPADWVDLTPADVAALRQTPKTPEEVHTMRADLKK